MDGVVNSMNGTELTGLIAVVLGIAGGVSVVIASIVVPVGTWTRRVEARSQLARELAANGFSAADIERIVRATGGEAESGRRRRDDA